MPVTTDACLFGAMAEFTDGDTILDIGAGSGLLSLMLAQRYPQSIITALEIHAPGFENLVNNCQNSPFAARLKPILGDILQWQNENQFDGIIWNPPFFENQLKSETETKSLARHTGDLSYEVFPAILQQHLKPQGKAWLLIPQSHTEKLNFYLQKTGFYLLKQINIRAHIDKPSHLAMMQVGREPQTFVSEELITYQQAGMYTQNALEELKPFYLFL